MGQLPSGRRPEDGVFGIGRSLGLQNKCPPLPPGQSSRALALPSAFDRVRILADQAMRALLRRPQAGRALGDALADEIDGPS